MAQQGLAVSNDDWGGFTAEDYARKSGLAGVSARHRLLAMERAGKLESTRKLVLAGNRAKSIKFYRIKEGAKPGSSGDWSEWKGRIWGR
jgi:hypothetical protein